jgi:hypothetical protein
MSRGRLSISACCIAIVALGCVAARGADTTKTEIKGGIEGKIVKVDTEKGTVTISREDGRDRTFTVTEETEIVGPRGGIVHRRLRDPRFHPGLSVTIVANGEAATQLHLGFDRKAKKAAGTSTSSSPSSSSSSSSSGSTPDQSTPPLRRTSRFRGILNSRPAAETPPAKTEEADSEDNDFPGKIKSVDPARHMLVVTLLNGKDRSFLLARDVQVMVNGHASRQGLSDSRLKPGMPLVVVTEEGGRKVKEVKITPAVSRRTKTGG